MQPLDDEIFEALTTRAPSRGPGRILLVGEHVSRAPVRRILEAQDHRVTIATTQAAAEDILRDDTIDLVIADRTLEDGDALSLLAGVESSATLCRTIVIGEHDCADDILRSLRGGAVDYLTWPIADRELVERTDAALLRVRSERQREDLISKLKRICGELDTARKDVAKQVDLLCSDLAAAYQTIAEQVNEVTMVTEFRTLVRQELDVEELLRTTLEYLLTRVGATNAAVFLPDADQQYGLGAYVNYDCPREAVGMLLDHLCNAICPQMATETGIIQFDDAAEFAQWIGADAEFLTQSEIVAYGCHADGRCLAVVVMFRSGTEPFSEDVAATLDALRPIFAEQLARVIHVHHRAAPGWPEDAVDDEMDFDDYGFGIAA